MRDLIRSSIGTDCLLEADAVHKYAVHGEAPGAVVAPRSTEEAAAIMKLATQEGFIVECAGAGTHLRAGNAPDKVDVVLTSARMNGIAEYEPADLVVAVQAGATFNTLSDAVSPHNQFFALDPAGEAGSTVGAAVATSAAGPLRFAHGTPRDQVLGLEIVTGDGRVLHYGGRVVKNVAGYDIVRLMVGSRGTLGFLTRINVRLKPQPEVDHTIAVSASSFAAIADITDAILAAGLDPVALEILSEPISMAVTAQNAWSLLLRLHGNTHAIADAHEKIAALGGSATVRELKTATWRLLAQEEAKAAVSIRIANLQSLLRETTLAALRIAQEAELSNARLAIHAGDGIVRLLADEAQALRTPEIMRNARAAIEQAGGSLIVERAQHGMRLDAFGKAQAAGLMQQMKKVFDPAGILSPGRFVV